MKVFNIGLIVLASSEIQSVLSRSVQFAVKNISGCNVRCDGTLSTTAAAQACMDKLSGDAKCSAMIEEKIVGGSKYGKNFPQGMFVGIEIPKEDRLLKANVTQTISHFKIAFDTQNVVDGIDKLDVLAGRPDPNTGLQGEVKLTKKFTLSSKIAELSDDTADISKVTSATSAIDIGVLVKSSNSQVNVRYTFVPEVTIHYKIGSKGSSSSHSSGRGAILSVGCVAALILLFV